MAPEMLRIEDFWDIEEYFKAVRAPFDDQVTMATMSLSGDVKLWWWLADETRPREPQIECILGRIKSAIQNKSS